MDCREFEQHSEQWAEGERTPEATAHVEACARCRSVVDDLEAIRAAAPFLADDAVPPAHLWPALRGQLEAEGLIHEPRRGSRLAGLFARPWAVALATACLAALVVGGIVGQRSWQKYQQQQQLGRLQAAWHAHNTKALRQLRAQLDVAERHAVSSMDERDPDVRQSLKQNLAIVDNSIAVCEKTLDEEPQNETTRDYLYQAYQQKAELVTMIAERGAATQ
jgi:hypothetical protein